MFDGIGAELIWDGSDTIHIPARMGEPRPGQMEGTPAEQLTELSGRVCYGSLGSKRSRNSDEYLKHIIDVGHNSVAEHYNATLNIEGGESLIDQLSFLLLNRPWVWVTPTSPTSARITLNCRVVMEFNRWSKILSEMVPDYPINEALQLGAIIADYFHDIAPRLINKPHPAEVSIAAQHLGITLVELVEPETDAEKWITLYTYGSRGFCYDSETEVLTEGGWVKWPAITGSERFATLNMGSEELEYQEASAAIHEPYHGEMVRVSSQCVDLLVTPNHRMVVRKHDTRAARRKEEPLSILKAGDLGSRRVKFKRSAKWTGRAPETFTIPDVIVEASVPNQTGVCGVRTVICSGRQVNALPFARMVGWWLAEGSLDHSHSSGYSTVISQSENSPHWQDIIECVEGAGFTYSINRSATCPQMRINGGRALFDYLKPFSGVVTKAIPPDLKQWGPIYQVELIRGFLAGDGSRSSAGHAGEGHTVSKQLADDLQEAALKAGWSATIRISDRTGQSGGTVNEVEIVHRRPVYVVVFGRKRGVEPFVNHGGKRHESREHYSGMIHCVTVPNGTLYVRRNGKPCWSGNSHELVRHGDFTAMCLSGDNVVTFVNKKGIAYSGNLGAKTRTMEWLYNRWQDPRLRAVMSKLRPRVLDERTGKFTSGKLLNVISSGKKPCFKITLENGKSVTCTTDHKIYTDNGWKTLKEIASPVLARNTVRWDKTTPDMVACDVENMATICWKCRSSKLNGHEKVYAPELLVDIKSPLPYGPSTYKKPRGRGSAKAHFSKIKSIVFAGEVDTYDLVLEAPNHGFVANGIVVHNSQRSTRYCNESKSPWTLHPLMQMYVREAPDIEALIAREETSQFIESAKELYRTWVKRLIPFVQSKIDPNDPYAKTTARKQARGAARGLLGNALETELVFSASVMQWKHMVKMRAADAADGEIRYCFQKIVEALNYSRYADSFTDVQLAPAIDGIGMSFKDGGAQ